MVFLTKLRTSSAALLLLAPCWYMEALTVMEYHLNTIIISFVMPLRSAGLGAIVARLSCTTILVLALGEQQYQYNNIQCSEWEGLYTQSNGATMW